MLPLAMPTKDSGNKKAGKRDEKKESDKAEGAQSIRPSKPKIPEGGATNLERRKDWFEKRQGQSEGRPGL